MSKPGADPTSGMRCSKFGAYSITSSARASSDGGTSRERLRALRAKRAAKQCFARRRIPSQEHRAHDAARLSWWLTLLLHRFPAETPFEEQMRLNQFDYLQASEHAQASLAEQYVGLPFEA
jgi:hypothetical protein